MHRLTEAERGALTFLNSCGGFTAGTIARNCGYGGSRSEMAVFRSQVLMRLMRAEYIELLDAEKPAIFIITDVGRRALQDKEG